MALYLFSFRLNDSGVDPGFGQSILHEGQLVFHTAPYDSCQVAVQDSYFYSKSALLKSTGNVKVNIKNYLRRCCP